MKYINSIFSLVFLLMISSSSMAAQLYVDFDGSDDANNCQTEESPCATIARAIDQASSGDTINIGGGTFVENLINHDKTLIFQGAGADQTYIDGNDANGVYEDVCTTAHTVTFNNMTIQNGSNNFGGGIYIDCSVGGEVVSLVLNHVELRNNDASYGGGLVFYGDQSTETVTINHSAFYNNNAGSGGGAYIRDITTLTIANTTFYNNDSTAAEFADERGGGLWLFRLSATLNNVTIADNIAGANGGGGVYVEALTTLTVTNTIFDNNTGDNCSGEVSSDDNNISSDATCSLDKDSDLPSTDALLGDFLNYGGEISTMVLLNGSPAINAGNNENCEDDDARDISRPQYVTCDIGAHEGNCGDSSIQGTESCDDGNSSNNDSCLNSCVESSCGDGFVETGVEECDEGGFNSDETADACRTDCSNPACGDGVTDSDESCDDANESNLDSCLNTCALPSCGDGFIQVGESCDDGDANSNSVADACRTTCVVASCGDGVVDEGEACDDGDADNTDGCLNSCVLATCGDGFVKNIEEACDDGDDNSDSIADACRTNCVVASCGDGVVDDGEACDEGDDNSNSVADACRTSCVAASCGDGVVDNGEACDDGNSNTSDSCSNTCTINSSDSSEDDSDDSEESEDENLCGNEELDVDEDCDDGNQQSLDGCSNTCLLEVYGDLESSNSAVDFDAISTDQVISLIAPDPRDEINTSILFLTNDDECNCTWSVSPSSFGTFSSTSTCETELTVNGTTQANLVSVVQCNGTDVATYNQTLKVSQSETEDDSEADSISSNAVSGGSCSLNNVSSFSMISILMMLLGITPLLFMRKNQRKIG